MSMFQEDLIQLASTSQLDCHVRVSEPGTYRQSLDSNRSKNQSNDHGTENQTCPICLEEINHTTRRAANLAKCKHTFCKECLERAMQQKPVCPICGSIYGNITGNQPDGTMSVTRHPFPGLPGYENYGIIAIDYIFPSGIQGPNHPNPGQRYNGTGRTAFLPDNVEGKKIERLLRKAFDARLIFTVGTSVTTGRKNSVTWNDIHHKTSTCGGPQCFGYPDETYLRRVTEELAIKGIE